MRLRFKFEKGEAVRFMGHLDLVRAFERALRRAQFPLTLSEGFNPHPRLTFASALPVGVTSEAEYLDVVLRGQWDPKEALVRLQASLPPGLAATAAVAVAEQAPALMAVVDRARYRLQLPLTEGQGQVVAAVVGKLMQRPQVTVTRRGKKGSKEIDIRPGIRALGLEPGLEGALTLLVTTGPAGNVRPEEVLAALVEVGQNLGLSFEPKGVIAHRTGLYLSQGERLIPPLEMVAAGGRARPVRGGGE